MSAASWFDVPGPPVPKLSLPGFARAYCASSASVCAGTDGCTTSRFGMLATSATGMRSRSGS